MSRSKSISSQNHVLGMCGMLTLCLDIIGQNTLLSKRESHNHVISFETRKVRPKIIVKMLTWSVYRQDESPDSKNSNRKVDWVKYQQLHFRICRWWNRCQWTWLYIWTRIWTKHRCHESNWRNSSKYWCHLPQVGPRYILSPLGSLQLGHLPSKRF